MKGLKARVNSSPGMICLFTLLINSLLFGIAYGGKSILERGIVAVLTTAVLAIYIVALISFAVRFAKTIDKLTLTDSILIVTAAISIMLIGLINFTMFYSMWEWTIRTGW